MERPLAKQFKNGPFVHYQRLPAVSSVADRPTGKDPLLAWRTGPDRYVPVNQASAMPVPKPRGIGARATTAHPRRELVAKTSLQADGTDAQPPPLPWLRSATHAAFLQPRRASSGHRL